MRRSDEASSLFSNRRKGWILIFKGWIFKGCRRLVERAHRVGGEVGGERRTAGKGSPTSGNKLRIGGYLFFEHGKTATA